jgi:hypothetical protein
VSSTPRDSAGSSDLRRESLELREALNEEKRRVIDLARQLRESKQCVSAAEEIALRENQKARGLGKEVEILREAVRGLEVKCERRSLVNKLKDADLKVLEAQATQKCQAVKLGNRIEEYEALSATVGSQLVDVEREYAAHVRQHHETVRRFEERLFAFLSELHEPWEVLHEYYQLDGVVYSPGDPPGEALAQIVSSARKMASTHAPADAGMMDTISGLWRRFSAA